jgi:hypothetical protein
MQFENFSFGSLTIDGKTYEIDVVIDRGEIRERKKKPSKQFRDDFGHTPLSIEPLNANSALAALRNTNQTESCKGAVMSDILQEVLAANERYAAEFGDKAKLSMPPDGKTQP